MKLLDSFRALFGISRFDAENESKFTAIINERARLTLLFVYWAGGPIAIAYLVRSLMNDFDAVVLVGRSCYIIFWGMLTYFTFYARSCMPYKTSYLLYVAVGTWYTTFYYGVIEQDYMFLSSSILLYLIGLLIAQLQSSVMAIAGVITAISIPVVFAINNAFSTEAVDALMVIGVWTLCIWGASIILERLNRRIFKIHQELQRTRDREAEANEAKGRFLAIMSHELRTPLTAVIGHTEHMLANDAPSISRLKVVERNSRHLLTLISDILDVSKLEAEKADMNIEATNYFEVIDIVQDMMRGQAEDKSLDFECEYQFPLPTTLDIDAVRYRQILINLLSNAIKFTDDGHIKLTIYAKGDSLCFSVEDTGQGISEDEQNKLFKMFSQVNASMSRPQSGTGLGLYLSRELAHKMHGEISVTSRLNKGSNFVMCVPISEPKSTWIDKLPETATEEQEQDNVGLSGRVLLADDFQDSRDFIETVLEEMGLDVVAVANGEDAVKKALAEDFDVILMDVQMPIMDGFEALDWLKRSGNVIPVIALTANVMSDDLRQYNEAGFAECLEKPVNLQRFYDVIAKTLAQNKNSMFHAEINADKEAYLASRFDRKLSQLLSKTSEAIVKSDWDTVTSIAHIIKGTAGNFNLPEVSILAESLLEAAAIKCDEDALKLVSQMKRAKVSPDN